MLRALVFAGALLAAGTAQAEQYTLDPAHTQVAFRIDRFGYNFVLGRFEDVSGEINLDQAHPERSTVHAIVQIASVDSGNDTRDGHLRGERWLNAAQFPTMEFRSTSVRQIDATHAEVSGELTLMGQTHPLTLNVTLNRVGTSPSNNLPVAGFSATGTLRRSQWGIATAPNLIGEDVQVTIEALGQSGTAPAR